ncbi:hypothetical protein NC652_017965 [Populus alba x Populus x berolinensis]|nr:hypothetical protein NC652_017965 [Populus alba x Populus x berolinensis]
MTVASSFTSTMNNFKDQAPLLVNQTGFYRKSRDFHSLKTEIFTENRDTAATLKQMSHQPLEPDNTGQNTSFAVLPICS